MSKVLMVCPKCHCFYSAEKGKASISCKDCGTVLDATDFDYEKYSAFTETQKQDFKKQYIKQRYHQEYHYTKPPFEPMPQSGWVGYIGCFGWLCLVFCIIGGVFAFLSGAFLVGIVAIFAGLASSGALILFSIVAEDVRHIRNRVDRFYHDHP